MCVSPNALATYAPLDLLSEILEWDFIAFPSATRALVLMVWQGTSHPHPNAHKHKLTAQEPAAPTPLNNKQDSQGYNPPKLASHVGQHPAGVCTEHSHLSREMSGRLLPG